MSEPDVTDLTFRWGSEDEGEEASFRFYGSSAPIPNVGEQVTLTVDAEMEPTTFVIRNRVFHFFSSRIRRECSVFFEVEYAQ